MSALKLLRQLLYLSLHGFLVLKKRLEHLDLLLDSDRHFVLDLLSILIAHGLDLLQLLFELIAFLLSSLLQHVKGSSLFLLFDLKFHESLLDLRVGLPRLVQSLLNLSDPLLILDQSSRDWLLLFEQRRVRDSLVALGGLLKLGSDLLLYILHEVHQLLVLIVLFGLGLNW